MIQIWGGRSAERMTQPNETNLKKLAAMTEKEIPAKVHFDGFIPFTHDCGGAKNFFNEPIC